MHDIYEGNLVQIVHHQQDIYFKNIISLTSKDDSEDGDDDGLQASVTRPEWVAAIPGENLMELARCNERSSLTLGIT